MRCINAHDAWMRFRVSGLSLYKVTGCHLVFSSYSMCAEANQETLYIAFSTFVTFGVWFDKICCRSRLNTFRSLWLSCSIITQFSVNVMILVSMTKNDQCDISKRRKNDDHYTNGHTTHKTQFRTYQILCK